MATYVILAEHRADNCPTSNAKVLKNVQGMASQIGTLLAKHKVKLLSGPHILGLSHKMVVVVDAPSVEAVQDFGMDAGLVQWNAVEVYASWSMEEALKRAAALQPISW